MPCHVRHFQSNILVNAGVVTFPQQLIVIASFDSDLISNASHFERNFVVFEIRDLEAVERGSTSFHKMNSTAIDRECSKETHFCNHELLWHGWLRDALPAGVIFRPYSAATVHRKPIERKRSAEGNGAKLKPLIANEHVFPPTATFPWPPLREFSQEALQSHLNIQGTTITGYGPAIGTKQKIKHMNKKLKIVVIGGSGLIGTRVVNNLRQRGHEVVAGSPSTGVNTITGEGLAETLAGADVVVDVANAPSWEDKAVLEFFETSGRNLLAAEAKAGVKHHVALSVVGTERLLASGYFRAKMAQENLIKASPIPYTIVRATQFFEFVGGIAQGATEGQTVRVPAAMMQPIAADDVAAAVAKVALEEPLNGRVETAGPDPIRQDELVRQFLSATGDPRTVIIDPKALYSGAAINDQSLTPPRSSSSQTQS